MQRSPSALDPACVHGRVCPRFAIPVACLLLSVALTASSHAAGEAVRLFRPISADPRESQSSWRLTSYTVDWRYGTDIEDSTSHGGVEQDVHGAGWDISAGEIFHWRPLERLLGWRGPWKRYQLGGGGGTFATFDNTGSLLNADYQFGGVLESMWSGDFIGDVGVASYDRPVVTSRLGFSHHSSHLGDEYLTLSRFGRNRAGLGALSDHPPVKRVELSYETLDAVLSGEWAPAGARDGTLRAYAAGEFKVSLPRRWRIGGARPTEFRSPAASLGIEWRSQGNRAQPLPGPLGRLAGGLLREPSITGEWFAALNLRFARPFNFACCDNASGEAETWTTSLSTDCPFGHPFAHYAGSWHGRLGVALSRRRAAESPRLVAPEWIVSLDWFRGYSPHGQLLDQRFRYRPRWYVMPGVTAHF